MNLNYLMILFVIAQLRTTSFLNIKYIVGDEFSANYFMSSSVTKSGALKGDFITEIYAPKGSRCAYLEGLSKYPKQREVLFDKSCKYKVLEKSNKRMKIEVIKDD